MVWSVVFEYKLGATIQVVCLMENAGFLVNNIGVKLVEGKVSDWTEAVEVVAELVHYVPQSVHTKIKEYN